MNHMLTYSWPDYMGEATRRNAVQIVDLIAAAADRGARCPTTPEMVRRGLSNPPIASLADMGVLRTEVYARNFRTVWICAGPHRGKMTRAPVSGQPYKVIGPARPVEAVRDGH